MIDLKQAIQIASSTMIIARQEYVPYNTMWANGLSTPRTENAHIKYDQLTEAIQLFASLNLVPMYPTNEEPLETE